MLGILDCTNSQISVYLEVTYIQNALAIREISQGVTNSNGVLPMTFKSTISPSGTQFFAIPCAICGGRFGHEDRARRFCSVACQDTAMRRFHLLADRPQNCMVCAKSLSQAKQSRYARTCSASCRTTAWRWRWGGRFIYRTAPRPAIPAPYAHENTLSPELSIEERLQKALAGVGYHLPLP